MEHWQLQTKLTFTVQAIFLNGHTNISSKAEKMEKVLAWLQRKEGAKRHLFIVLKDREPSSSFTSLQQQKCNNPWTWVQCKHVLLSVLSLPCHCPWKPKCHVKISINKGKAESAQVSTTLLDIAFKEKRFVLETIKNFLGNCQGHFPLSSHFILHSFLGSLMKTG